MTISDTIDQLFGPIDLEALREKELNEDIEMEPTKKMLIAFTNGSYKTVEYVSWKHSEWIHFASVDGTNVRINSANVKYLQDVI